MPDRKIVFLHPRWQQGGVEQTNLRWAEYFQSQGCRCSAITWGGHENLFGGLKIRNFGTEIAAYWAAFRDMHKNDILIVCQSYFLPRLWPLLVMLKRRGVRLVLTERNSFDQYDGFPMKRVLFASLLPRLFKLFDHIIVNAQEMAEEKIFQKLRQRVVVVRNPRFSETDIEHMRDTDPQPIGAGVYTFCRWAAQKDPAFLEKAAAYLQSRDVDFAAYCGEATHGFQKPFVADALHFMAVQPRIVLFCSKFEGYPNLLVEARALGLPILFAPCNTGVREILADYPAAFEFDKSDMQTLGAAYDRALSWAEGYQAERDFAFIKAHSLKDGDTPRLNAVLGAL